MRPIRLLDLGAVSPLRSQTCYHAAASALNAGAPDTIILVRPASPYVCIGYHQDVEKEVDREYCRERGWPIYRREVGGGAVYLDGGQTFLQWVFHPESLPTGIEDRFRLFSEPLVRTYRSLGIEAQFRPINDIHVGGKKIGGTGAARIGDAEVVVGSLMFDFDKEAMARLLKVSSEKMRDKVHQSLEQYMTTIRERIGDAADRRAIEDLYVSACAEALGAKVEAGVWTDAEEAEARAWDTRFQMPEWLASRGVPKPAGIKIHEDVKVVESDFKAPGGLIRLTARLRHGRLDDLSISGDFTIAPATAVAAIEDALRGLPPDGRDITDHLERLYRESGIRSPGLAPEHWAEAVRRTSLPENRSAEGGG
jgi:lipoate---protein ligase